MSRRITVYRKITRRDAFAVAAFLSMLIYSTARGVPVTNDLIVRTSRQTGLASFVTARDGGAISVSTVTRSPRTGPADFLHAHGRLFGVTDPGRQLASRRVRTDALGHTHTTYGQVHDSVPVFSGMLKIHQDATGRIIAANGDFYPLRDKLNTTPTLTGDDAAAIAIAEVDEGDPGIEKSELVIVDPGWYGDPPIGEQLAYHLILSDATGSLREAFFVDAHTGDILDRWSMVDRVRDRLVYDGFNTFELPGWLVRTEGDAPDVDVEVNRAYDYMGDTYDYLFRAFGRDSLDGNGLPLVATVNSLAPGCPNATWTGALQTILCTGLATDDILAHELAHGLTGFTANLIYQNQSGQLNESYSDVFGELIDLFNGDAAWPGAPSGPQWPKDLDYGDNDTDTPNGARAACDDGNVRWLIGEDYAVLRDMWDPTCRGNPDRAFSHLQTCGGPNELDNGGVHSGSGIPNHAFAILTDGKSFNTFDVTGIGPIKAAAVWYRALTTYLTVSSDFEDAYNALNQAAQDLIDVTPNDPRTGGPSGEPFTAFDAAQVDLALRAVEMNSEGNCGATADILDPTPPQLCTPRTIIYSTDFENGQEGWTSFITAGNPPTPYDWVLSSDLPLGREGTAAFAEDRNVGACTPGRDESAVHALFSPVIDVPPGLDNLRLMFIHYVATETGWDGGNVWVRADGGIWELVPTSAFIHNPYNLRLQSVGDGNTNPMANEWAFSGAGGGWGVSYVDLSGFTFGAETIQLRFNFGKDGCTGVDGWYVDDVQLHHCHSCPEGEVTWAEPPDGTVLAGQPRDINDPAILQGLDSAIVIASPGAEEACWSLCETAVEGTSNLVRSAVEVQPSLYVLEFDRPITPGAVTKVTYTDNVDATSTATFTSLPGDANADGVAEPADSAMLVDCCLNMTCPRPFPSRYICDIDQSEVIDSEDVLRLMDLLNGAGEFTRSWNMAQPHDDGECPSIAD